MKMKICIVSPYSEALLDSWGYNDLLKKNLNAALNKDTEVVFKFSKDIEPYAAGDLIFNSFSTYLNGTVLLEKMYEAQEEGCDGVMACCACDPVLDAARGLLKIPIVGCTEAGVLSACMCGPKFGLLSYRDRRCGEMAEDNVIRYGLAGRMTETVYTEEKYDGALAAAYKNPEMGREAILEVCKKVIEKGAHSVVIASAALSSIATAAGITKVPEYDAPVFDVTLAAAKMLEYRIALQKQLGIPPISHAGHYKPFSEKFFDQTMKTFQFSCKC